MIQKYLDDIIAHNGVIPQGWGLDPYPMQICKLSDALHKAKEASK